MAKKMARQEIDDFLYKQKIGLLSLTDGNNAYAVPMGYSYDGTHIYISMIYKGRKKEYLKENKNICFVVYWTNEDIGVGNIHWKSVICDGTMDHLKEHKEIEKAVRTAEKHLGLAEGTWDRLINKSTEDPDNSMFWRIHINYISGHAMG